jgi:hypothetical protein
MKSSRTRRILLTLTALVFFGVALAASLSKAAG